MKLQLKFLIAIVACHMIAQTSFAASCTSTISAFPYVEDFESGPAGWVTGGTNNDWTLGSPAKPIITAAASGSNCWITGGLATSFYQYGERSWVESPCFDFTDLDFPVVSFQIFWEIENQYDGGNFQYSLDGGTTWNNVGTTNEPQDCFTQNWFNQVSITNLSSFVNVNRGWSGTILPSSGSCVGGNGSGEWKLARHCLKNLANEPQVVFRFTFGSGNLCNDYDGFAFDDFRIAEADRTIPSFSFSCVSSNEVSFTDGSTVCPVTWNWIFGDGSTSTQQNPSHTFVSPGIYEVKLITGNNCSLPDTISETITIVDAVLTSTDESCAGTMDGSATVTVNPPGVYNYSWNTIPVQNGVTASGLSAGTYTVSVTGTDMCSVTESVDVLITNVQFNPATIEIATSCVGASDGMAIVQIANDSLYTFSWNTVPVQTTDTAFDLTAGTYIVTVNGPGLCAPLDITMVVPDGNAGNPENILGGDTTLCTGNEITIQAGSFSAYLWENGTDAPFLVVDRPGYYSVEVTTLAGCKGTDSIYVEEKCLDDVVFPSSFTPNDDGRNEVFYAYGIGVKNINISIFNRWGELIFESDSIEEGWDGRFAGHAAHDGIYVCLIRYSMDGSNYRVKKGKVALIR